MYKYILDEKNNKEAVILSIKEFEKIQKELKENKKRIEMLEDELDIKLSKKVLRSKEKPIAFDLKNYV
jgi:PHD/YefM family antitoxin component YafN of YafNO toxin-antitoxin module